MSLYYKLFWKVCEYLQFKGTTQRVSKAPLNSFIVDINGDITDVKL